MEHRPFLPVMRTLWSSTPLLLSPPSSSRCPVAPWWASSVRWPPCWAPVTSSSASWPRRFAAWRTEPSPCAPEWSAWAAPWTELMQLSGRIVSYSILLILFFLFYYWLRGWEEKSSEQSSEKSWWNEEEHLREKEVQCPHVCSVLSVPSQSSIITNSIPYGLMLLLLLL